MKRKKVSVHTPGMPMRLFVLSVGLIAAGMHAFILRSAIGDTTLPLFMVGLLLIIDAFLLWWGLIFMMQSRVTLFEEGIELERGGSKLFTTWDNVSHFGIKGMGKNARRGLFLYDAVRPETTGLADKLFFGWKSDFIPIGQYVHLPRVWSLFSREINTDKLLETDFGKDVYQLAPHLFEEYDEWKPKNQLRDQYDTSQPDWLEEMSSKQKAKK